MANCRPPTQPDPGDPINITVNIGATIVDSVDPSGGKYTVKEVILTAKDKRFVDGVIYVAVQTDIVFTIVPPVAAFSDFRFTRSLTAAELVSPFPSELGKWFAPSGLNGPNDWVSYWPAQEEFMGVKPTGPTATTMTVTDISSPGSADYAYLFMLQWTEGSTTYVGKPKVKIKQSASPSQRRSLKEHSS